MENPRKEFESHNETTQPHHKIETEKNRTIKGILAIVFGLFLVILAHKIILRMIFFTCGILFIYYGLIMLKIKQATSYIDRIVNKIRKLLFSNME
jgi:hypothetical protein